MQLTSYLIFILVLVFQAIGLCFTATQLEAFKFSRMDINSHPVLLSVPHQASFIVYVQIPTTLTLLTPGTLPPTSHNWGPTYLSIPDVLSHPHLYRTTVLQLSFSMYSFIFLKLSSTACRFSLNGGILRVIMHWCALIGVLGVERFAS